MSLNSQYMLDPPQPDNPTPEDRHLLFKTALKQKGWPGDFKAILMRMAPPVPVTSLAQPGIFRGVRVGIAGGGLAGLSAAYELRKLGFDITVFDALTDRVGGRVYTYAFGNQPGLIGEFGPMRIPVSHETVWHYIREFRLSTYPFIQSNPNSFIYLKNIRVRNDADGRNVQSFIYPKYALNPRERAMSWQKLLYAGTDAHLLRASQRARLEILETKAHYAPETLDWINKTSLTLMEEGGLSQAAINLVSNFAPLLDGNLYSSFIDYIQESYPADLSYLYAIDGGTARLPSAFYQSFFTENPYGSLRQSPIGRVTYRPGCLIRAIAADGGGRGVTLCYDNLSDHTGQYETFDYLVCALPFSTLRNVTVTPLFSGQKMRAIREVNYTPSQKMLLCCRERFWEKQGIFGGGSYSDLPVASLWYPSDSARRLRAPNETADFAENLSPAPGVLIGSYNFNLDTTRLFNQFSGVLSAEVLQNVAAVHGLTAEAVTESVLALKTVNWNQEPTFRGALCFYTPAQKRLFAADMALPEYDNRVFFAGEHVAAVHRWMQGALQTGMQAANDLVLSALSHHRVSDRYLYE
ncbi:FAD-dependent oxidoreductase [Oscillospiraceae bacterium CM]|nr:FAD-dependent oxidoreductase [Oscillospiraceae bacterium CM]